MIWSLQKLPLWNSTSLWTIWSAFFCTAVIFFVLKIFIIDDIDERSTTTPIIVAQQDEDDSDSSSTSSESDVEDQHEGGHTKSITIQYLDDVLTPDIVMDGSTTSSPQFNRRIGTTTLLVRSLVSREPIIYRCCTLIHVGRSCHTSWDASWIYDQRLICDTAQYYITYMTHSYIS